MECINNSIDAKDLSSRELNLKIRKELSERGECVVVNPHSMHNIGTGLGGPGKLTIKGSTGFYTGGFLEGATVVVDGNAGWYAGDNMIAGELIVTKNAGCNAGAYFCGGTMVIKGSTGSRVGFGMKDGTIIVCGNSGRWSGQMTLGGRLIMLGELGNQVGESMYKGVIYTRDPQVKEKLGGNVYLDQLTAEEQVELTELFKKYQIEAKASELQAIRPSVEGRHTYTLFKPQLTSKKPAEKIIPGEVG